MNVTAPFLRRRTDTRGMMLVMLACLGVTAAHFALRYDPPFMLRFAGYLALGAAIDLAYGLLRDGRLGCPRASTLVTVALLVLSVPAHMPWWQVGSGVFVAVFFGKRIVDPGALRVNPMLLGRLFMMILFANSIQTWLPPDAEIDALSSATPLGLYAAEGVTWSPLPLWLGEIRGDWEGIYAVIPGSPGEVLPLLAIFFGLVLYVTGVSDWRAGTTFVLGFAAACLVLDMPLVHHLSAGSVFFTAVYIVSDPRSMPGSKSGRLIAGLLAGVLNAAIRQHGYLPEGVVPAVLAVNLLSPTLDRLAFAARGLQLKYRQTRGQ